MDAYSETIKQILKKINANALAKTISKILNEEMNLNVDADDVLGELHLTIEAIIDDALYDWKEQYRKYYGTQYCRTYYSKSEKEKDSDDIKVTVIDIGDWKLEDSD